MFKLEKKNNDGLEIVEISSHNKKVFALIYMSQGCRQHKFLKKKG